MHGQPVCEAEHASHAEPHREHLGVCENILLQHSYDGPRALFLKSDADAAGPRTTLNEHFVESIGLVFSVNFGVDVGRE